MTAKKKPQVYNRQAFASVLCKFEGLKKQVNRAQMLEILKIQHALFYSDPMWIAAILKRNK